MISPNTNREMSGDDTNRYMYVNPPVTLCDPASATNVVNSTHNMNSARVNCTKGVVIFFLKRLTSYWINLESIFIFMYQYSIGKCR